jgi:hypothetical protein
VKRWYPQIVALASSPMTEIRQTVAWTMGQDHQSEEFHAALVRLLTDKEPIVRRNAATALVRFGDASGRPELLAMLQPHPVAAPFAGTINSVLPEGSSVKMGSLLARIKQGDERLQEVRSPLSGKLGSIALREGMPVAVSNGWRTRWSRSLMWGNVKTCPSSSVTRRAWKKCPRASKNKRL